MQRINNIPESVRVLYILKPLGVAMAGENEVDPYKD